MQAGSIQDITKDSLRPLPLAHHSLLWGADDCPHVVSALKQARDDMSA
jgi:hypothetical protein